MSDDVAVVRRLLAAVEEVARPFLQYRTRSQRRIGGLS
jgi:hypothetical protein